MPTDLLPIAEIIRVKRRPETTLSLREALSEPRRTVDDYVFTDSIRDHFHRILRSVQDGRGQGFWVQAEYGGGKTHFLATLAALLEGDEQVWNVVHDDEIRNFSSSIRRTRLFPVVFSLRGQAAAGVGIRRRLYDVLEEQIESAARDRLGTAVSLNSADELLAWYEGCPAGLRADLDGWVQRERNIGIEALVAEAGKQEAAAALAAAAAAIPVRPDIAVSTIDRLRRAYRTVVEESGRYSGLLVMMDEFAFWQQQHPEGTEAHAQDEDVLETLGWVLRHDYELPIYTIVASQMPPPVKLSGGERGRFEVLDVLRGESQAAKTRDYLRIVNHRVCEIRADRRPEAFDYLQHYRSLFPDRFRDERDFDEAFPIERHAYEILQLLTQSLASERVGINVVWEVLGRRGDDSDAPLPSLYLSDLRRLVVASDLLQSATLQEELQRPMFSTALKSRDALFESLDRLDLGEELPLAERIAQALFLWYLANQRAPRPMTLSQLTEAALIESEMYGSPENTVLALVGDLQRLRQIEFDAERSEIAFKPSAVEGPDPATIYAEYTRRVLDGYYLAQVWRAALVDRSLRDDTTAALFAGVVPDQPAHMDADYRGVLYRGEYLLASEWSGKLGGALQDRRFHARVVYLQDDSSIEPSQLQDGRIAVVVPGALTDSSIEARQRYAAYKLMLDDYSSRSDPEALSCRNWLEADQQKREIVGPLLRAQREVYRAGQIVTREALSIDPRQIFSPPDAEPRRSVAIAEKLLATAYAARPFPQAPMNQPIRGSVPSQLFNGLFGAFPPAAARDAVKNYAPSLGLSKTNRPDRLDAASSPVFAILRERMAEADAQGRAGVPIPAIYDELWRRGVPEDLVTLFLLAFVYSTAEGAELTVRSESRARVKLGGGSSLAEDRIIASIVRQLDFSSLQPHYLDALVKRQGVTWDEALPWLRQLDSGLTSSDDPQRIGDLDDQVTRLAADLCSAARQALDGAMVIGSKLHQPLPADVRSAVEAVEVLRGAANYQAIYDHAGEACWTPEEMAKSVRAARNLQALNEKGAQIVQVYDYLEQVPSGRLPSELATERDLLLQRFDLAAFLRTPALWDGVAAKFDEWRRRYQNEYAKLLRSYFADVTELRQRAQAIETHLAALANLEDLPELPGQRLAGALRERWQGLLGSLPVGSFDINAIDVTASPVCTYHGVPYGTASPREAAQAIEADLEAALQRSLDVLRGETVRRLLEQRTTNVAQQVSAALGALDDDHWVRLLSDREHARLVGELLSSIETREVRLLDRLRERFPTITRENLDDAVAALRDELVQTIEEAERERGAGVTVAVTLR